MGVKYILYNPYARNGKCRNDAKGLADIYDNTVMINMSRINSYEVFFEGLEPDAEVMICGGDGTLNRFVNETEHILISNPVFYYAAGTGNNFARDLGHAFHDIPNYNINPYIKNLPAVTVNGERRLFINGIGYGIDGYCREAGEKLRQRDEKKYMAKPVNDTVIGIKGILFHFSPRKAVVTVDGKKYTYEKVWMASAMNGRYDSGGMMPAPAQNREGREHKVSLMIFHGAGKLKALMIFPSIFHGGHIKHTKQVSVLEGKEITVEFDRPAPLQIDGDLIPEVTSYTVSVSAH